MKIKEKDLNIVKALLNNLRKQEILKQKLKQLEIEYNDIYYNKLSKSDIKDLNMEEILK